MNLLYINLASLNSLVMLPSLFASLFDFASVQSDDTWLILLTFLHDIDPFGG